jgi:hypothetical protein
MMDIKSRKTGKKVNDIKIKHMKSDLQMFLQEQHQASQDVIKAASRKFRRPPIEGIRNRSIYETVD